MGLSRGARDRALRGIVAGPIWVGLATEINADKGVVELEDVGYSRQPVSFGDPVHSGVRSNIASVEEVRFPQFVFNSSKEIRYWFLTDEQELTTGAIIATGQLEPIFMMERKTGKVLTVDEAKGKKELFTPVYQRALTGASTSFPAGGISLGIAEE